MHLPCAVWLRDVTVLRKHCPHIVRAIGRRDGKTEVIMLECSRRSIADAESSESQGKYS